MVLVFPFLDKIMSITQSINTFPTGGKSSYTSDLLGLISHANSDYVFKDIFSLQC